MNEQVEAGSWPPSDFREQAWRYEAAAHAASLGVWDWHIPQNEFFYSPRAREICGLSPDAPITLEQLRDVTHPDDLPWTVSLSRQAIDPAIRANSPYRYRIIRADTGEVRWVLAHGHAIFDPAHSPGQALRYVGTLQDITDQKLAEDALAESEARLRLAIEAANMAVWELDLDRGMLTPSPELNVLFGFAPDARPSLAEFRTRYAPGEADRVEREGAENRARGLTSIRTEFKQLWPDGTVKWVLLRAQLVAPTEAIRKRVIGVVIDITDRKLAEERSELVAREMQHRIKNLLAVVGAIADNSFRGGTDANLIREIFRERLRALSAATGRSMQTHEQGMNLATLVQEIVEPYRGERDPFAIEGQDVPISSPAATSLALGLHELCTNAVKYGALSNQNGRVTITWTLVGQMLNLTWSETGGPQVTSVGRPGFGTSMIERGLSQHPGDNVDLKFDPSGLRCLITMSI